MGFLPLSFVFTTRDQRQQRYPFSYKSVHVIHEKKYPFAYTVVNLVKSYPFKFKRSLPFAMDRESDALRMVIKKVTLEDNEAARRNAVATIYLAEKLKISGTQAEKVILENINHTAHQATEHICISSAQFASILNHVPTRIEKANETLVYKVLATHLDNYTQNRKNRLELIHIDDVSSGKRLVSVQISDEHPKNAQRIIIDNTQIDTNYSAEKNSIKNVIDDKNNLMRRDYVQQTNIATAGFSERQNVKYTQLDKEKHQLSSLSPSIFIETRENLVKNNDATTVLSENYRAKRLQIYTIDENEISRMIKGAKETHIDETLKVEKNAIDTVEVHSERHSKRLIQYKIDLEQDIEATCDIIRPTRLESEIKTTHLPVDLATIEHIEKSKRDTEKEVFIDNENEMVREIDNAALINQMIAPTRIKVDEMAVNIHQSGMRLVERSTGIENISRVSRKRQVAGRVLGYLTGLRKNIKNAQLDSSQNLSRIYEMPADIEESERAFLQEIFEAFPDEATEATSIESFLTDIIDYADASLIETFITDISNGMEGILRDEWITDVDEPIDSGLIEKEKKKLIWLISGRPSWIMQWNQWKKTR